MSQKKKTGKKIMIIIIITIFGTFFEFQTKERQGQNQVGIQTASSFPFSSKLGCAQPPGAKIEEKSGFAAKRRRIGPRWPQDGARMAQDCPEMAPRWPKIASRWPQDGARCPKMAPRLPEEAPRGLKMAPRWPQGAPRWRQDGPKNHQLI